MLLLGVAGAFSDLAARDRYLSLSITCSTNALAFWRNARVLVGIFVSLRAMCLFAIVMILPICVLTRCHRFQM
jgi:hypothetical protein